MLRACMFVAANVAVLVSTATAQDVEGKWRAGRPYPASGGEPSLLFAAGHWEDASAGCTETVLTDTAQNAPPVCRLRFSVPAWLPEVHGSATVRGREAPVNISTRKLFESVEDLNFVFAGRVELTDRAQFQRPNLIESPLVLDGGHGHGSGDLLFRRFPAKLMTKLPLSSASQPLRGGWSALASKSRCHSFQPPSA